MSRLVPVSRHELISRLKKLGFEGPYPGSGHAYMIKQLPNERIYVTIPNQHHGKDIGTDLLTQVLREGGISREEWQSAT